MGNCENCDSDNGVGTYCTLSLTNECGCGELTEWRCRDCGHTTPYYHATRKAKEVLGILLANNSTPIDSDRGGIK